MVLGVSQDRDDVLEMLAQTAAQGDDAPVPLGEKAYSSQALFDLELQTIFKDQWVCAGRLDELRKPGDYTTLTHGTVPILVVKQESGAIEAMLNICSHRMAPVAKGRGNLRRFICPYHAWAYDLDGSLLAAPRMPDNFKRSECGLRKLAVETWMGFIYVNPDASAPSLADTLKPLSELFRPYPLPRMKTMRHSHEVWECNWKIAVENFLESYHFDMVHTRTLAPFSPQNTLRMVAEADNYAFHEFVWPEGSTERIEGSLLMDNPDITPEQERTVYFGGVFPNHLFTVQYDQIAWLRMQPLAVDRTLVDFGLAGAFNIPDDEPPDPQHPEFHYLRLADTVNAEDRAIVEAIQTNARSGLGSPSRLHPTEHGLLTFARYINRRVRGSGRS
jgi:choline monooxygenase